MCMYVAYVGTCISLDKKKSDHEIIMGNSFIRTPMTGTKRTRSK